MKRKAMTFPMLVAFLLAVTSLVAVPSADASPTGCTFDNCDDCVEGWTEMPLGEPVWDAMCCRVDESCQCFGIDVQKVYENLGWGCIVDPEGTSCDPQYVQDPCTAS